MSNVITVIQYLWEKDCLKCVKTDILSGFAALNNRVTHLSDSMAGKP